MESGWFSWDQRKLWNTQEQIIKEAHSRRIGSDCQMRQQEFLPCDRGIKFSFFRQLGSGRGCPERWGEPPSLGAFKAQLDKAPEPCSGIGANPAWSRRWD